MAKARLPRERDKRVQESRAADTIKALLGDAEGAIARHRAELAKLIEAGRVSPIFGGASMRDEVFDAWLQVQDRSDPEHAFTVLCRRWYAEMKRTMPCVVALKESLAESRLNRERERRSVVEDAAAFLEARSTRPLPSEIDEAMERGELSREAAILVRHGWELKQRFQAVDAEGGLRDA